MDPDRRNGWQKGAREGTLVLSTSYEMLHPTDGSIRTLVYFATKKKNPKNLNLEVQVVKIKMDYNLEVDVKKGVKLKFLKL